MKKILTAICLLSLIACQNNDERIEITYNLEQPIDLENEIEAICDTDSDCLKHCPPPNDDPDCDGGPQS